MYQYKILPTVRFRKDHFLKILVDNLLVKDEQSKRSVPISGIFNLVSSSTEYSRH